MELYTIQVQYKQLSSQFKFMNINSTTFNQMARKHQEQVTQLNSLPPNNQINQPPSINDQKEVASDHIPIDQQKPICIKAWWDNLSRRGKTCCIVTSFIFLIAIILIPIMVHRYVISPETFDYQNQRIVSYAMPKSGQKFAIVPVTVTKRKLFGENEVYQGHYVIFKHANQTASGKVRVMVLMTDKQTGITVKKFNGSNQFIIQVDPKQLMKFYYKNYQIEAKRLLAQAELSDHDHIESSDQIESPQFAKQMLQFLAVQLNMTDVDTQLVLQEQYKGWRTVHGFELKHKQSSWFDNPSTKRNLRVNLKKKLAALFKPVTNLVHNIGGLFKSPPKTSITTTTTNTNVTNINNTNTTTTNINTGQGNVVVGSNNTLSNPQSQTTTTNNQQKTVQTSKQQTKQQKVETKEQKEMVIKRKGQGKNKNDEGLDFKKDGFNLDTIRAGTKCIQIEGGKRCPPEEWLSDHSPYQLIGDKSSKDKVGDNIYVFSSSELLQLLNTVKPSRKE